MADEWDAFRVQQPAPIADPWSDFRIKPANVGQQPAAVAETGGVRTETTAEGRPRVIMDMTPAKQDRGALDAGVRGAMNGLTANFYDELRGVAAAGGAGDVEKGGREGIDHVIMGLAKYWFGDKDAEAKYNEVVKRERGLTQTAEEQHPYASLAGNVAGAVALPIGAGAGAANLGARMVIGGATGAALGSAAGAGEGQGGVDTLSRAVTGAATGGVLGAAGPAAIEGVVKGARAIASPIANAVRGVRNADDEAARRVALSVQRDMEIDPQAAGRLTPQEFVSGRQAGDPVNIMDIGGETTRGLARSAANTSPEGRAVLGKAIDERFEGQTPRVTSWLEKNFNYPDATKSQEAIKKAAAAANRPAYAQAYAKGQALWDDGLDQLSQAPVVQQAIRMAFVTGQNRGALAGFPPIKNPFSLSKESNRLELADGAIPNLQFWDHVKRNLDDLGSEGRAFSKALRTHLDHLVPEYQAARSGAAAFFGAEDALEAGQKIVTSRMKNSEIARGLSKMSPEERKLAQDGFVSDYIAMLRETGDRRNVLNKIAESPAARQRLEMVLGPQKAKELEVMLRVEGIMDAARPAVQGNSTTARQLAELGLAGGTYGFSGGDLNPFSNPSALANAALVYGAAKGKNKINENVSRKVAEMLASNDPATLLRGIKVVASNQVLFNSLRSADKGLARVGGSQAPTGMLSLPGVSRAEDQQAGPRPPAQ